jgi:mannose-6-phosphate isomerase-like protein (cupin superfamily)
MTFPFFKGVVMPQRYNMPYGRQKPLCHFFVIFLKNTKNYNIVDNFGIYNRNESAGDEIKLFNVHGYCIFSLCSIFMTSRENYPINMFGNIETRIFWRQLMNETEYPYATKLNILHKSLEIIDIQSLVKTCKDKWFNQTLCKVNDSVVRVGILQGEYHWHKHDKEDEFFFTLDGKLIVDVEGLDSVELHPQQGYVVPRGVIHRTRAPEKTIILMIETAGIVPTGDAKQSSTPDRL